MSLMNCYKCSKIISETANICPHCKAVKQRECYECYKEIDITMNYCSSCGSSIWRLSKIGYNVENKFSLLL